MNLLCIIYNFVYILHLSYIGNEQHFKENKTTEYELVFQISRNFDILDKVRYLEKCKIIDDASKQILDDYLNYSEIRPVDLNSGGLMSHWNFDIDET